MVILIADNSPRISYAVAAGVTQTSFVVPFEFFDETDLNVYVDDVEKTLTTDYTVTGGDGSTGSVTISVTGAAGGSTVVITRDVTLERVTDFPASGPFQVNSLNTELDKIVAMVADMKDLADRGLRLSDSDTSATLILADKNTRKGTVLAFNETTGAVEVGPTIADVNTIADVTTDIATLADIEDGTDATDAIQTLAAIAANVTTVAGISSDVTTVATNNANVTAVANAIANITTVAGSIANVNTVAGIDSDVSTVSGISANVTTVAGRDTDIGIVAARDTDIGIVADRDANIGTVAGISGNVTTVAGIASNVTTVAGISSDVTAAANIAADISAVENKLTEIQAVADDLAEAQSEIDTVAGSIANVDTVGGNIANVNTVAGANANITTVATNISDVNTVATNIGTISAKVSKSGDTMTGDLTVPNVNITSDLTVDTNTLYVDSTNNRVGVGTTSPDTTVTVNGSSKVYSTDTANSITHSVTSTSNYAQTITLDDVGLSFDNNSALRGYRFSNNGSERMRIDSYGNVGIGTTSPREKLDVAGDVIVESAYDGTQFIRNVDVASVGLAGHYIGIGAKYNGNPVTPVVLEGKTASDGTADAFTVRLDNSEKMRINSSGKVGVGTSSPSSDADRLHVDSSGTNTVLIEGTGSKQLFSYHDSGGVGWGAGAGNTVGAGELLYLDDANSAMRLYTNGTERMRITSAGNIGIGNTSPATNYKVDISGRLRIGNDDNVSMDSAGNGHLQFDGSGYAGAITLDATGMYVYHNSSSRALIFGTNDTERVRILAGGGMTFNGDTASANALDDYEEGSWTPAVTQGTISFSNAKYTKVGRLVTISCNVYNFSNRTSTAAVSITGLPFTPTALATSGAFHRYVDAGGDSVNVYLSSGATDLKLYANREGLSYNQVQYSELNNASAQIYLTLTYQAS